MGLSPEQPEVQHDSELTLLVPDDHIALLIQDGLAMDLLEGGRHRFPSPFGRLKVVWIHQETIRNQAPEDFWSMTLEERLPLVRRLPRERVHLYVDRVLVAMIKPAWSVRTQGSTSNGRILPSVEPSLKPSARETMEDPDPVQRFSFI